MTPYEDRRRQVIDVRLLGAPAASAAAWLSAIDKAERAGEPCPDWPTLEQIATSLPPRADAPGSREEVAE